MAIADQSVAGFLDELASSAATPGGGAAAALVAAVGAALVSMVANLSKEDDDGVVIDVRRDAARLRAEAVAAADDDAVAFGAVSTAYRMSRDDAAARTAAIQSSLAGAVEPPLAVVRIATDVARAAERLLPVANANVVSDIAVAARCCEAAIDGAAANVLVNLGLLKDPAVVDAVRARFDRDTGTSLASALAAGVEERLAR